MLDSLYIRNFRLFKELTIERLGRVNLFVGKNNAGKTCLLEALWIYAYDADPHILKMIISEREEYWEQWATWNNATEQPQLKPKLGTPPPQPPIRFLFHGYQWTDEEQFIEIGPIQPIEARIKIYPNTQFPKGKIDGLLPSWNRQFLSTRQLDTQTVLDLWDNLVLTPEEDLVIEGLQLVDSKIQKISVARGSRVPIVVYEQQRIPLRNLGEGMTRVFLMLLCLINARDGFLLIDEFENGLYWKVQPKLWAMIFQLAKTLNVQVFATTHSRDCVAGFHAAWETQEEQGTFYRLNHRPNKGVVATPYHCETLADTLEMDGEMR
ncbi:conserved hypothetical protein [Beggiatoa sp. PS]|nr:conserved hypothetical protein [Beggiatoa sp. PS]